MGRGEGAVQKTAKVDAAPACPVKTVVPEAFAPPMWENPAKVSEKKPVTPQVKIAPVYFVRFAAAAGLIVAVLGVYLLFARLGRSPVMMAGVQSAASSASVSVAPTPQFVLTGITDSGSGKLALINNQVVGIGDRLKEKAFVKSIGERSAVLDYSGKEIRLSL